MRRYIMFITMMLLVVAAESQDVYTAGTTAGGEAAVYRNGQMLYQLSGLADSYALSVVVDPDAGDVYYIVMDTSGSAVYRNGEAEAYLPSGYGTEFNALAIGGGGLYTAGCRQGGGAAVWLNDNAEPLYSLTMAGYETRALGVCVARCGDVYTCGYACDVVSQTCYGVVWKDGVSEPVVSVSDAWVRDVAYYDGHVYSLAVTGVSGSASSLVVYEDGALLYTLTEDASFLMLSPTWYNPLYLQFEAGNLYVSGLRDGEHVCIWKNGQVMYEFGCLDFSPLVVSPDGVHYIIDDGGRDYVYRDGERLFQLESGATGCSGEDHDVIPYNEFLSVGGRMAKIYNPYKESRQFQYTGQLHCHTWTKYSDQELHPGEYPYLYSMEYTESLTEEERRELLDRVAGDFVQTHKDNGYDFIVISNYSRFGDVTHQPANIPEDILWLFDSYESTTITPVGGVDTRQHIIVHDAPDYSVPYNSGTFQEVMDLVQGYGCVVQWPHPTDGSTYASPEVIGTVRSGLRFMEVYDGISVRKYSYSGGQTVMTNREAVKAGVMLDDPYDDMLSHGNFTFCVGISDERPAHGREPEDKPAGWNPANNPMLIPNHPMNIKNGCVKVFADELTRDAVFGSLMSGNFYVSSNSDIGINSVTFEEGRYMIDVGMEDVHVEFLKEGNTVVGAATTSPGGTVVSYDVVGDEKFVRARLYKLNGLSYDADYWYKDKEWMIWTQPVFISPAAVVTYDLFVDVQCADDTPRALPFVESFNTGNTSWDCWTITDEGMNWDGGDHDHTCASYWHRIVCDGSNPDNQCAKHKCNGSFDQEGWLISPKLTITAGMDAVLTFNTYEEYPNDMRYEGVLVSTTGTAPDNFSEVWTQNEASAEWKDVTIDLSQFSGYDIYIAFKYAGENGHSWYIDDIFVDEYIPKYNINVVANDPDWGIVTGGATYEQGTNVTITATPNNGCDFLNWIKDGSEVLTEATYCFTATENATYTAQFTQINYTITVDAIPVEGGTVTGSGTTYHYGDFVTLTATPNEGYDFINWDNGDTNPVRTVTVDGNAAYFATFVCDSVDENDLQGISLYPNPANESIRINGLETETEISIYNAIGALVKVVIINADDIILISELPAGLYVARFGENCLRFTKK